ncbi:unnamed protein product [Oppiella nova]|uniref:Amidase domain-containing protein n=1 Tax=Oppiella nova TaxID=334625 RepID=A0A7R9M7A0_9ACAR|nr:unnamed protein product [Oppiella nova]CAG2172103.1 unnamed protein product [Oppiella nova]
MRTFLRSQPPPLSFLRHPHPRSANEICEFEQQIVRSIAQGTDEYNMALISGKYIQSPNLMSGSNASKLKLDKTVDFNAIKVYYMEGHNNPGISPLQPEVRQSLNQCVDYLRNKCRDCERIYLKELEFGFDIWMCAMTDPTAPALEQELVNLKGRINPYVELVKSLLGVSNITFPSIISCFDDLITGLSSEHVFVYPGHPETAPKHNGTVLKVKNISYTCVFNTLDVAITSVPLGLSTEGLPIGVQIINNPFNDHLSIAVAEELERRFGGWTPPAAIIC